MFRKYLDTLPRDRCNLFLQAGGKRRVPEDRIQEFAEQFDKARATWTKQSFESVVWAPPRCDPCRLYVDLDLRYGAPRSQPVDQVVAFAKSAQLGDFTVVAKERMYEKKPGLWAGGAHVYFDAMVPRAELEALREKMLPLCSVFEGVANDHESILDKGVFLQKKGLFMPGCFKKGSAEAGRYCVKGVMTDGEWIPVTEEEFLKNDDFTHWLLQPIFKEYPVLMDDLPTVTSEFFNLNNFIEATAGHVPNESEWKQILMYVAKMQLDVHKAAKALNLAWGETSRENLNFLKRYQHASVTVGEGSMRRYLSRYGREGWEELEIFKKPLLAFRNDVEHFRGAKMVTYEEVFKWMRETFRYTWGDGSVVWIYKEKRQERCGKRQFTRVQTIIKNQAPFYMKMGKGIDYMLNMEIEEEDLDKRLRQLGRKPKFQVFGEEIRTVVDSGHVQDKKDLLRRLGAPAPATMQVPLGELFVRFLNEPDGFAKFHRICSMPYLHEDPSAADEYNVFDGFSMRAFANTDVNLQETNLWRWLTEALAPTEYKRKWLFNFIAHKIQQPSKKVCKFLMIFSVTTGSGKTTVAEFLSRLFDSDKVLKIDDVRGYTAKENSEQLNKLIVCLDDIERLGKRDADALKSRVTASTFRYKKLYQDTVTQPCYCDLVCTTNDKNPVFVDKDDRRCEIVSVVPKFAGNDAFWDKVYDEELEDPAIMGAFFHFFATLPLTVNVRSKNVRFDRQAIINAKRDSMNQAHRFLCSFFKEPDCLEEFAAARKFNQAKSPWFHKILWRVREQGANCRELVVGNQKLFALYRFWKEANNEKNCMGSKTFFQKMEEAGAGKVRFVSKGSTSRFQGRVVQPAKISKTLSELYNVPLRCECFWTDDKQWEAARKAYDHNACRFHDHPQQFL